MKLCHKPSLLALAGLALWTGQAALVHASLLDWDIVDWDPDQALTQSYTDVDNSDVNIDVAVTGNTNRFISNTPRRQIADGGGGLPGGNKSIRFRVNYADNAEFITVTVDFSVAVTGLQFTILDVDVGSEFTDNVTVFGFASGSGTQIAPSATSSVSNEVLSPPPTNAAVVQGTAGGSSSSDDANATFDFGTNQITSFAFEYRNTAAQTGNQSVFLHNITFFSTVPEADAAWGIVPLALGVWFAHATRRRRQRLE